MTNENQDRDVTQVTASLSVEKDAAGFVAEPSKLAEQKMPDDSDRDGQDDHQLSHSIGIAIDCDSSWDSMTGIGCVRQCADCWLWVLKTDDLSDPAIANLLGPLELGVEKLKKLRLFRRSDGTFSIGDCYAKRRWRGQAELGVFLFPFWAHFMEYILAPGYLTPFLNHPTARVIFVILILWHLLGCALFARTRNVVLRVLIVVVFTGPLTLCTMIGPSTTMTPY